MIKVNYHTHVKRCKHARGNVEEHVKTSIENGFQTIGISDHMPAPIIEGFPEKFVLKHRMNINELEDYLAEIEAAKQKYGHLINIYGGFECEYWETHLKYLKMLKEKSDYLVFGNHRIKQDGKVVSAFSINTAEEALIYANNAKKGLESGLFNCMVHPDLYLSKYQWNKTSLEVAKIICKAAKDNDIPLEINAKGISLGKRIIDNQSKYLYPREEFWEVAKQFDCKIIVGLDAHSLNIYDSPLLEEVMQFVDKMDIKLVDKLSF